MLGTDSTILFPAMDMICPLSSHARHRIFISAAAVLLFVSAIRLGLAEPTNTPGSLRDAVQRGDTVAVERLLDASPGDQRPQNTATALIAAAFYGKLDVLNALLEGGVSATTADARGWTALMAAVKGNQPGAVDLLLAHGAAPDARPVDGGPSAVALAAELGRTAITEHLRRGIAPARKTTEESFALAVQDGRLDAVKACLSGDPAFKTSGKVDQRALLLAIQQKDTATATILLDRGADANAPVDDVGTSPLSAVASTDNADLARTLLDHGADPAPKPTISHLRPPLADAIAAHADKVALVLIQRDAQAHRPLPDKHALLGAIGAGTPALIGPLIDAGADVDAASSDGTTPLMWAVQRCPDAIDPLLAHHPRLDLRDHDGRSVFDLPGGAQVAEKLRRAGAGAQVDAVINSPHLTRDQLAAALVIAVKKDDSAAVRQLLDQGADPETCNKLGWPVSVLAAYDGDTDILRLLYERAPFTATQDGPGHWNPLNEAAGNGHLETVKFLLACHAEPQMNTDYGSGPLDYAEQRGFPEVAAVLRTVQVRTIPALPNGPMRFDP